MKTRSKTDWKRVKDEAEAPVAHDPETELYDPNVEDAVKAYWKAATVTRWRRPPVDVKRPTLN